MVKDGILFAASMTTKMQVFTDIDNHNCSVLARNLKEGSEIINKT